MYYLIEAKEGNLKKDADGHDSEGALFVKIEEINSDNIAPIALKAIRKI
ncbi:hypothetical protein ACFL08_00645 [Patescibacteria group bacterium]